MKKLTLTLVTVLIIFISFGQIKKDLVIAVAAGALTSPHYLESKAGRFYNIDFDYYLANRHILSVNYHNGYHDYYDNILSTDPGYIKSNGTNAQAHYATFSILYKYKFLDKKSISGAVGTGAGIMTHKRQYPYKTSNSSIFNESSWTDLVFPVRLEFDYKISTSFRLGVIGGFYIQPDYPILAYYAGPRLSYMLK